MNKEVLKKEMQRVQQDPYRLHYHLMPPMGSLADPNGMCQIGKTTHIYYVHNPMACLTNERTACVWGHYSTEDFVHFQSHPYAIRPDHPSDKDGVYSGSSLYEDGKLKIIYTGNVRHQGDFDYVFDGREQNVLMVESSDAICFENKTLLMTNDDFPGNMTKHVRDPQVFKMDEHYYMVLGARNQEHQGLALLYESWDMKHWQYLNQLTTSQKFGYMWECPDLIKMNEQMILITCPQGVLQDDYHYQNSHQCGYFMVDGDWKNDAKLSGFNQFDFGFDFYAARTFLNDHQERILIAWMGMSEADYTENMTKKNGWMQAIAMPRKLIYKDRHLYQKPIEAMESLRQSHQHIQLNHGYQVHSLCFECQIDNIDDQDIMIYFKKDCYLKYHQHILELNLGTCGDGRKIRTVELKKLETLHIFSDTSYLEIFINDGYYTMTTRLFDLDDLFCIEAIKAQADFYELGKYEINY